jgi:hypothetical protein
MDPTSKISGSWTRYMGIRPDSGFAIAAALAMFAFGALALSLAANAAAVAYADSVDRTAERIQKGLYDAACADVVRIVRAKDAFARGHMRFAPFECDVDL